MSLAGVAGRAIPTLAVTLTGVTQAGSVAMAILSFTVCAVILTAVWGPEKRREAAIKVLKILRSKGDGKR
jgi:hypothetical protein